MIAGRKICRIKFHRGVEFKFTIEMKQGVSEEIYQHYAECEDVQIGDILLVRDGTYIFKENG